MLELECKCGRTFEPSDAESAVRHFEEIHAAELPSRQKHGWQYDLDEVLEGIGKYISLVA